ncbi:hypothetical protein DFH06DRAFT_759900 [Mycena polygramma]|nr:hypothetical protein DFH06DRAFT_759900 [Mycena polygramma]
MPIFSDCADFEVHNGTFYAVHGDMNFLQAPVDSEDSTLRIRVREEEGQPSAYAANSRRRIDGSTTREEWHETGTNDHPSGTRPTSEPYSRPLATQAYYGSLSEVTDGGGTYITTENVVYHRGDAGIHILHRCVAHEAIYDSAESFPQPRCHPETRTEMLDNLWEWATNTDPTVPVLWLHGPAGAGKSAVMQTLCHRLQDAGRLGGSFFFRRGHPTRGNGTALFATLAYQLAIHNRLLAPIISRRAEKAPSLGKTSMTSQLRELIVEPCRSATDYESQILLIDGLDECDGATAQQEILRSIRHIFCAQPLPLRMIIASRPEPDIREVFEETAFRGLYKTTNIEQSFQDVEAYLRREFSRIHREHQQTMVAVPEPWPHPDVVEELVLNSSGYFAYAATVIRFVDDRDFRPTERLAAICVPSPESNSPFAHLDQMYIQILSTVPLSVRPRLLSILCTIMNFHATTTQIEILLRLDDGDVQLTCRRLSSLLQLGEHLEVHHASFRDFLGDPSRSGEFHIGLEQRKNVARSVLNVCSRGPRRPSEACSGYVGASDLAFVGIRYLISEIPPREGGDVAPLFIHLNLDLFWFGRQRQLKGIFKKIIRWLENITPVPQEVVRIWKDYAFMQSCDSFVGQVYRSITPISPPTSVNDGLPDTPPLLLRIFQTYWLSIRAFGLFERINFYHLRFLLDLSWDDMRLATRVLDGLSAESVREMAQLACPNTALEGVFAYSGGSIVAVFEDRRGPR